MNEDWKLHDLVVVKHQPTMQFVQLSGLIAVITEIDGDYATIAELELSGQTGSCGAVEVSCLKKPVKLSAPMRAAYVVYKQLHLQQNEEVEEDEEDTFKRHRRSIKIIAENNSIKPAILHKMLKDLNAVGVIQYHGFKK